MDEYDPDGRFAWDMIGLTDAELDALAMYADTGMIAEAESIVDVAEERMFGLT